MLELTLKELFVFRFMQTDPNWGNFLYNEATKTINLIDFGAARDYPKKFVDDYLRMVKQSFRFLLFAFTCKEFQNLNLENILLSLFSGDGMRRKRQ